MICISNNLFCQQKQHNNPAIQAKQHFVKGVEFFKSGDYEAALAEFLESYRAKENWALKYNIGVCYMMVKQYTKSYKTLNEYLLEGAKQIPAKRKKEVEKLIAELKSKIGSMMLCCNLGKVNVIIDDVEKIETYSEKEINLDPGIHKIIVRKEGYSDFAKEVIIASGETRRVIVELVKVKSGLQPEMTKPENETTLKETKKIKVRKKRRKNVKWIWTGMGVGGAFAAVAIISGSMVLINKNKMEKEEKKCSTIITRDDCPEAFKYKDRAENWKIATNVLIPVAILSAGTGVALYLLGVGFGKNKNEEQSKFFQNRSWSFINPFKISVRF